MILHEMKVEFRGGLPGTLGMSARDFHAARRAAWKDTADYWHDHFREKHFTHAGAREYGYKPRKGEGQTGKAFWRSYTGRKQRYLHHTLPLVFSGAARKQVARRKYRITSAGKKSRCEIILNAPHLNYRHPASEIDMREEMTALSKAEIDVLVGVFNESLTRRLAAVRSFVTYTVTEAAAPPISFFAFAM